MGYGDYMKEIPLHGKKAAGRVALIDDEDYPLVSQYKWYVRERELASGRIAGPYAITIIRNANGVNTTISMHVLILNIRTGIDHQNHNGLDNRRCNLRPAGQKQNQANQRATLGFTSSYKGVSWDKVNKKWRADIKINWKRYNLGRFILEEDAAQAYDAAARKAWGDYALLNFPQIYLANEEVD